MSGKSTQGRRSASTTAGPSDRPPVKTSVPLTVETHAKLAALSALSGEDRGALAAKMIEEGLRGMLIIDKRRSSGKGDSPDPEDSIDATAA